VLLDGESVKSCTVLAAQAEGSEVTTLEGLARDGELHPVQQAFRELHALQCGFCTPGMVMAAVSLIAETGEASDSEIRTGLEGNFCRCTGYHNIVRAVQSAAAELRGPEDRPPASEPGTQGGTEAGGEPGTEASAEAPTDLDRRLAPGTWSS
jgi:carbon-monoxide dehydrogenase small subunit